MKITENKTAEQALKYFEEGRTMHSQIFDPAMSEVYGEAFQWKQKHVPFNEWKDWPIDEICVSIISEQYM